MNVMTFTLVTGAELIGNNVSIVDNFLQADNVVILQFQQDPSTGRTMKYFGDFPALAQPGQTLRIPISSVLVMPLKAHEELERQYLSQVTGLELPPAAPKILLS